MVFIFESEDLLSQSALCCHHTKDRPSYSHPQVYGLGLECPPQSPECVEGDWIIGAVLIGRFIHG